MPYKIPTLCNAADGLWGGASAMIAGFTVSSSDLTGPVAALILMICIGIAAWRGAGVLFRAWISQCEQDRKERMGHHAENQ